MIDGGSGTGGWTVRNSATAAEGGAGRIRRRAIDGLVLGRKEFWIVVAGDDEDPVGILRAGAGSDADPPLRICRGVLEPGFVLIGDPDLAQDTFLSELLATGDAGNA